ncbi:YgaP-like transmembrane domain [Halobellus sp. GM3]|uniref:YgaP-like transmembrane domain n=1 Tax=Halobellus sp. GM3 TaxID=3458410 RepID=UPI00403DFE0E
MEQNVGRNDSVVRIALGAIAGLVSLGILANAVSAPPVLSPVLGVVALVLLATGVTGRCGLYSLLGVDTCEVR